MCRPGVAAKPARVACSVVLSHRAFSMCCSAKEGPCSSMWAQMHVATPAPISTHIVSVELGGAFVHVPCTGELLDQLRYSAALNCGASRHNSGIVSQPHSGSGPFFQPRNAHDVAGNGRAFGSRIGRSGRPTVRACYKKLVSGQSDKAT